MNLSLFDWSIVAALLVALLTIAAYARRYTRGVTDFLSANRCAGRYLLTLSEGLTALGLVGVIANFEKFYKAGFAASWWGLMMAPIGMVIALSGWVNYRYRETRALTMAEFFERRYSRRFRVFAGILGWASGVLNYGIFPGVTARFLVYFCGLPPAFSIAGLEIPTIAPVMLAMLSVTLFLTLSGGMVTVMITDFLQAQFINIVFLAVGGVLLAQFAWGDIANTLSATPPGKSLIDPFDQAGIADFNVWFFLIFAFKLFYNRLGWQGTQGFNCAAKSPHEAKMAGILAEWRGGITYLILTLIPICAYVLLHNEQFAAQAAGINAALGAVPDEHLRSQVTVPLALVRMLPVGAVGLLCAALVAGTIGNDTTYLHAWGSIFVQDVYLPLKKKTDLPPAEHLRLLRLSILGVAAFAFVFSLVFPLRDYILMYQLITGAIYLGGSGAAIIGGLYWRRGTTKGAWWGMGVGSAVATAGALLTALWPGLPA
ncbi:MAG: sodium:solute symporter, partial [Cytophagales bacterium]|nr:sodium:solute symporter [Armatimonadota bacterium]